MTSKMHHEIYIIETNIVIGSTSEKVSRKKRGGNMGRISCKSLKTDIEKMSAFYLSTMLMKTSELQATFHDSYEKKGS